MKWFFKKKIDKEEYDAVIKYNNSLKNKLVQAEISRDNAKKEKQEIEKRFVNLEEYNKIILDNNSELENQLNILKEEYKTMLIEKNSKIKSLQSATGGFKGNLSKQNKEIVKRDEEIQKLKLIIEDLKSNRYLVKKIPSGKIPGTQKVKVKSKIRPITAKYQRNLMKELDEEEVK